MNRPALAAATLVLLAGAWWYSRRASDATAAAPSSSSASLAWDFSWPSLADLTAPFSAIESTAQSVIETTVAMVSPDPVNADANLAAFLRAVRLGEGTSDADGYRRIFGGELVSSFADHPRKLVTAKLGGKTYRSDAAGAYQAMSYTWDDFIRAQGPHDFSPASQDAFAVWCIRRRGALADVKAGRFDIAVQKCAKEWASLPGSPYGQPTVTLAQVRQVYQDNGGAYA